MHNSIPPPPRTMARPPEAIIGEGGRTRTQATFVASPPSPTVACPSLRRQTVASPVSPSCPPAGPGISWHESRGKQNNPAPPLHGRITERCIATRGGGGGCGGDASPLPSPARGNTEPEKRARKRVGGKKKRSYASFCVSSPLAWWRDTTVVVSL